MKTTRFFPLVLAASIALALHTFAADENTDAGPAPTPEEQQAIDQLTKRGALVQPLAATLNWRYVNLRGIEKPDAAAFALVGKLPSTVELDLSGSEFKPEDLAPIAGLKFLTKLNLSRSSANDAALAHVKGLEKLEMINLFHTDVTDAGLVNLNGLKNLKRIYLFETKVTDAGAASLAKALPALRIDRGWDKNPPVVVAKAEPPKVEPPKPEPPKPEEKKPEPPKPVSALTAAKPEEVGLDPAKIAAIHGAMADLIAQKRASGVVTLVVKDGRLVHHDAAGFANVESGRLMSPDQAVRAFG